MAKNRENKMTNEITKLELEDLGYDEFFDSQRRSSGFEGLPLARVVAEHKEAYKVKSPNGEYLAKITGKQMFKAVKRTDYPAVGDWVVISESDGEKAVIRHILPRKTILKKKYSDRQDAQVIAVNIDTAFIVESLDRDYNLNRFERYLVLANETGIEPVIVLNKTDLVPKTELDRKTQEIKDRFGDIDIVRTSVIEERGLDELTDRIAKGKTYCFLGSSGVGKSSLINKLLKKDVIKTKEISGSTGKGRHTTTTREMYFLENGGIVIDNPGTREVGMAEANAGIENVFDEIIALSQKCKYADCTHVREPGCAVLQALREGKLDKAKYQNYLRLKKENEFYGMTDAEKRNKDRRFGKLVKKAVDQLKEFES